ncbi:sestrin-1 isoform x1 [Limosa lapponica baueri]|uniref:Sestrin-1 isoform x1 n=1 Tax=Limosa lapponica baueri TaxID=1758121 RepID=A0A2I0UJ09_LIMLA|nr:sestrin-1 isoform x1 [Limosa lapponica baueri]
MEEREGEVRWDGLCSRDAASRAAALDNIGQAVLRRSETIAPPAAVPLSRAADGLLVPAARDGLSEVLARLLMLSKRCPFPDVREKSEAILSRVQSPQYSHDILINKLGNYDIETTVQLQAGREAENTREQP